MIQAVIFDMDGVISDTQHLHARVESLLLKKCGIMMSPREITEKYAGVSDEDMFAEIFAHHAIHNQDMRRIIAEKWTLMERLSRGTVKAVPYAASLIIRLKGEKVKLAVASASTKRFIHTVLDSLALRNFFDTTVSAQEVIYGKPAPDIFLLAAKRLSVDPKQAVVIEDGRSGMLGAKAAGMQCVGLVADPTQTYPADFVVTSLNQVSISFLKKLSS